MMNHTSRNMVTTTRKSKDRGEAENSSFYKGSFEKSHHKLLSSSNNNNAGNVKLPRPTTSRTFHPSFNSTNRNPGSSNILLAGYMAHEFLTKGTLLGKKFDPAEGETVLASPAEPKRTLGKIGYEPGLKPNHIYSDMAQLLKADRIHIPGVVNPTQLAQWIHK